MASPKLNIQIQNTSEIAAGVPALYTDSTYNQLKLSISVDGDGSLNLKGGDPKEEGSETAVSTLYISLDHTQLEVDGMKNIQLDLPEGWTSQYFDGPMAPNWAICPTKDVKTNSVEIGLSKIVLKSDPAHIINFSIDAVAVPGLETWEKKITVRKPPQKEDKDLRDVIKLDWQYQDYNEVFLSTKEKEYVNELMFSITNTTDAPLVADNSKASGGSPAFTLSFVYGTKPGYGALCTASRASKIEVKNGEEYGNDWNIHKNEQGSEDKDVGPTWTFSPGNSSIIGSGSSAVVEIILSNLISYLQDGLTPMYLSWNNIPGYFDAGSALTIQKFSAPVIEHFSAHPDSIILDDKDHVKDVKLSWTVKNAPGGVNINGVLSNNTSKTVQVNSDPNSQKYTLSIPFGNNEDSFEVKKELHVTARFHDPRISINASVGHLSFINKKINSVVFSWEVAHSSSVTFSPDNYISGQQKPSASSKLSLESKDLTVISQPVGKLRAFSLTLTAGGLGDQNAKTSTITLLDFGREFKVFPEIDSKFEEMKNTPYKSGEGYIWYSVANNVILTSKTEFEGIRSTSEIYLDSLIPDLNQHIPMLQEVLNEVNDDGIDLNIPYHRINPKIWNWTQEFLKTIRKFERELDAYINQVHVDKGQIEEIVHNIEGSIAESRRRRNYHGEYDEILKYAKEIKGDYEEIESKIRDFKKFIRNRELDFEITQDSFYDIFRHGMPERSAFKSKLEKAQHSLETLRKEIMDNSQYPET